MKPRGYLINGNFYDENVSDSELDLVTPLYLEAPQTKPLSDEEIEECYWGDGYPDNPRCPKDFARAIEAKVRGQ